MDLSYNVEMETMTEQLKAIVRKQNNPDTQWLQYLENLRSDEFIRLFGNPLLGSSSQTYQLVTKVIEDNKLWADRDFEQKEHPLMIALQLRRMDLLEFFIKIGFAPNEPSFKIPILCEACHFYPEAIPVLLKNGADPNISSTLKSTPLMIVFNRPLEPEYIQILLDYKAEVNAQGFDGASALCSCCCSKSTTMEHVNILLKAGANINHQSNDGYTPLMHAVERNHGLIQGLVENGADMDIKNKSGVTAFDMAELTQPPSVEKLLIALKEKQAIEQSIAHKDHSNMKPQGSIKKNII